MIKVWNKVPTMDSQKTLHSSPSQVSYGVFFASIFEKNNLRYEEVPQYVFAAYTHLYTRPCCVQVVRRGLHNPQTYNHINYYPNNMKKKKKFRYNVV